MWLKLSDDFAKDCRRARLSDAAFRLHVEMLCFVMDDENGGYLNIDDVIATSRATQPLEALRELVACDFWAELTNDQWQIVHQMEHQPELEVLAKRRQMDAERQRRKRRKAVGLEPPTHRSGSLSRRDDPRDPGRVGTGLGGETQQPNPALEEDADTTSPPCGVDLSTGEVLLADGGLYPGGFRGRDPDNW